MSAVKVIPMPGHGGPCGVRCEHEKCAEVREIVFSICRFCRKTIGFLRPYQPDPKAGMYGGIPGGYFHDFCFEKNQKTISEATSGNHSTNVSPPRSPEPSGE